jgi:hypothetical protein
VGSVLKTTNPLILDHLVRTEKIITPSVKINNTTASLDGFLLLLNRRSLPLLQASLIECSIQAFYSLNSLENSFVFSVDTKNCKLLHTLQNINEVSIVPGVESPKSNCNLRFGLPLPNCICFI